MTSKVAGLDPKGVSAADTGPGKSMEYKYGRSREIEVLTDCLKQTGQTFDWLLSLVLILRKHSHNNCAVQMYCPLAQWGTKALQRIKSIF